MTIRERPEEPERSRSGGVEITNSLHLRDKDQARQQLLDHLQEGEPLVEIESDDAYEFAENFYHRLKQQF
jgi:hypothetical protein